MPRFASTKFFCFPSVVLPSFWPLVSTPALGVKVWFIYSLIFFFFFFFSENKEGKVWHPIPLWSHTFAPHAGVDTNGQNS